MWTGLRTALVASVAIFLVFGRANRQTSAAEPAPLAPGDYSFSLKYQDRARDYLVHVPPQAARGGELPVVLNFHGGGGNAAGHRDYSHMDFAADRFGFIAVYPDGSGGILGKLHTFNAGRCCGYAMNNQVDDVGFSAVLLDHLAHRASVDRLRVYATGLSNGAMMAYRLAMERPDLVAAIAAVAGSLDTAAFTPKRAVPIMHIHSIDDPRALYRGGLGPPFPFTNARVDHPPVETMLQRWIAYEHCPASPKTDPTIKGPRGQPDEGNTATKYTWVPCDGGSEIVLWKLSGSGHVWPGGTRNYYPQLLGQPTGLIDANEQMWRFFEKFSLPKGPSAH
jgi:polyhydroxybutyrate depolymerase